MGEEDRRGKEKNREGRQADKAGYSGNEVSVERLETRSLMLQKMKK